MTAPARRHSGIGVPLFSLTSSQSWGVGEFTDLPAFASWCDAAGQAVVQLLPLHEIAPSETSPYSSMTAMALDPIYLHVPAVPDFAALGGEAGLTPEERDLVVSLRADQAVRYADVRRLKLQCLARAYARFCTNELAPATTRAEAFHAYTRRESWWLDPYTSFRAIHAAEQERAWWDWAPGLAYCDPEAVRQANTAHADDRQFRAYLQWLAEEQWQAARAAAPVRVFGDLPFMVSGDSPDVWARKDEFMLDATVGVPPDAFSETGQDWGLPPWRWDVMQSTGFQWMRARARRTAALFDGVRIDHLVGLYRIYVRPIDQTREKVFSPPDERSESLLGARLLGIYQNSGVEVIAEDLGTVPDFVRHSMARLAVPGFKVMRWERAWREPSQPLIDPATYPEASVALSGTHDTESLVQWWRELPESERRAWLALPGMGGGAVDAEADYGSTIRDTLLRGLLGAGSRYVICPLQDVFGWDVRINTPATVTGANWTWRSPVVVDRWRESAEWVERAAWLAESSRAARRHL